MRVAIAGGTGFVGTYLVEALLAQGHSPAVLVRPGSEHKVYKASDCDLITGDINLIGDVVQLLKNCEVAIYNIGILRERRSLGIRFDSLQYQGLVRFADAAKGCRVKRLMLMSANGARANGSPYQDTKYRAEQYALNSGMHVTVFRPSVIFGDPRGAMEIATQLQRDMILSPLPAVGFFNAFGSNRGEFCLSPVHVEDVASAFVNALDDASTVGNTYTLAGPEAITWKEMLRRIAEASGRKKWIMPVPIELMRIVASFLDSIPAFPVTRDQLTMLAEGNTGSADDITALIGQPPRAFDRQNLAYLAN